MPRLIVLVRRVNLTRTGDRIDGLGAHGVRALSVNAANSTALRNELKRASKERPRIIRVAWDDGGGHAVMVDRHA